MMLPEQIVLQSAGSISVAILALLMVVLQLLILSRKPRFILYGWSTLISLSAMIYATGVFMEYNYPAGTINAVAGRLELTAVIFMLHAFFGFTLTILEFNGRRYHLFAGLFHCMVLSLLWLTDRVVSNQFAARHFFGLARPFIELELGPWGIYYVLYASLASIGTVVFWVHHNGLRKRYNQLYLAGFIIWITLGIHDGLAVLGMPTYQYLMEYGFLGFSVAILLVVFDKNYQTATEGKYRMITELANDGILVVQNRQVIFSNPACDIFLDQSILSMPTEKLLKFIHNEDRALLFDYYERLTSGQPLSEVVTIRLSRLNGLEKTIELKASFIRYNGKPALLCVVRDVTKRVLEEKALKKSEEKIARLKKMESLGLLAGGVAHDLNNVLSGIVSYPDLLLMELASDSSLLQPIQTIKKSGQRATAIVQDLLTIARGVAVEKTPLSINTAVHNFMLSAEFQKLKECHPEVAIDFDLTGDLLNIIGSAIHMDKVVMNLVSNAAEAIDGKGTVWVSTGNRHLDRPLKGYQDIDAGTYAVLTIRDDGPGISTEALKRIFEPFYSKKVMGRSGTGLGLAVVWNVVQDHCGHINITSNRHGTCFELYFPVTQEHIKKEIANIDVQMLFGQKESILVVDDIESQREITCRMLEKLGYNAQAVDSGEAAVEYVKKHPVQLLLLDMIMAPGIDGLETFQRIKAIQPDQKAILLSGFAETRRVKKCLAMGAARYLKKPVLFAVLGKAVKDTLAFSHDALPN